MAFLGFNHDIMNSLLSPHYAEKGGQYFLLAEKQKNKNNTRKYVYAVVHSLSSSMS